MKLSKEESLLCVILTDNQLSERQLAFRNLKGLLGDKRTFTFTLTNQVASMVGHVLMDTFSPKDIFSRWEQMHNEIHHRISAYLTELDRMAAQLARESIPMVALKNGGIARGIYPCPGCCPMGDMDVLVEKKNFRKAHAVMISEGYHFEFRSPIEKNDLVSAEQGGGAEYWKILPDGEKLWLELQWRPVAGRWIRPDQEPTAEELMARSIPIIGTDVRLLSPEDNLLQVSLHTAKHSYVRAPGFRLHTDVDRIVRRQTVDWNVFLARVLKLQVKTAVYFSLAIPNAIFQTPIPEDVLKALRPPIWKEKLLTRMIQRAGLFNPDDYKFNKIEFIIFTGLLYDDLLGLTRGAFPDVDWMRAHYGFEGYLPLPYYYTRRLIDLTFRRNI